ncbi:hypothetical protein KHQ81_04000 [Mycoplasmatota bacterium]|nr:hypothetical protein KHQ81_04000 [Mycoplasmatota bacterium]
MNTHQIYEILPEHFFSVLACTNQVEYADCLFLMFHYLGKGNSFGGKKESIIELLSTYFNQSNNDNKQIPREKAIGVLRRLRQCGWIFEEEDANYEVIVNFTSYAIPLLKTLSDLKKSEALEYLGYIFIIYSAVKNMEIDSLSDILDQIYYNTTIVMNKLKSLNANIKKYIQDLLNKKDVNDLKSIVSNLFVDYKKNIIDKHYQRLKTSENISKYRPFIISKLNEISMNESIIKKVSYDLVKKEKYSELSKAKSHIYDQIDYIISSFENFEHIMSEIDKKNSKYIHTSISKILFIVNNSQDLQGKINLILRHYVKQKKMNQGVKEECVFNLFPQKYLAPNSLYTMPDKTYVNSVQTIESEISLSFEEKQKKFKNFFESNVYNLKHINSYVKQLLNKKERILASSLPLNNYVDYTKLILIYMYSGSDVDYSVDKLNQIYQNQGYLFYDFEIRRK